MVREIPEVALPEALPADFYDRPTEAVARELIGRTLVHFSDYGPVGGIIVETEAYGPEDPANHAFRGRTGRNATMFGPPGRAYVYRIYGVHWCLNAVTGGVGTGEAVLIRALQPLVGLDVMRANRSVDRDEKLCRGPGAVCAALGITGALDGTDLESPPLIISAGQEAGLQICAAPRIGITKAADRLWRFFVESNHFVSGPRRLIFRERR